MKISSAFISLLCILLVACGGGGGGGGGNDDGGSGETFYPASSLTDQLVYDHLFETNLMLNYPYSETENFTTTSPYTGSEVVYSPELGLIKHWVVDKGSNTYIPVKTGGVIHAEEALDAVEEKLGYKVFDRESIADVPLSQIEVGIVFLEGTALGPTGEPSSLACGHVGDRDSNITREVGWYVNSVPQSVLTVNVGNNRENNRCILNKGLVVHELMHAMGMAFHFDGFGNNVRFDDHENDHAYSVLWNIYNNDPGTHQDDLDIILPYGGQYVGVDLEDLRDHGYVPYTQEERDQIEADMQAEQDSDGSTTEGEVDPGVGDDTNPDGSGSDTGTGGFDPDGSGELGGQI